MLDGVLQLVGQPSTEFGYDRSDIESYLLRHRRQHETNDVVTPCEGGVAGIGGAPGVAAPATEDEFEEPPPQQQYQPQQPLSPVPLSLVFVGDPDGGKTPLIQRYVYDKEDGARGGGVVAGTNTDTDADTTELLPSKSSLDPQTLRAATVACRVCPERLWGSGYSDSRNLQLDIWVRACVRAW